MFQTGQYYKDLDHLCLKINPKEYLNLNLGVVFSTSLKLEKARIIQPLVLIDWDIKSLFRYNISNQISYEKMKPVTTWLEDLHFGRYFKFEENICMKLSNPTGNKNLVSTIKFKMDESSYIQNETPNWLGVIPLVIYQTFEWE